MNYQQICPLALASEVLAERWTPLIIREIVLYDRHHFSEIQHGVGPISQSLLVARLRELVDAGILERRPNRTGRGWEYHATQAGRELDQVLTELGIWAQHWIELRREHSDPSSLMNNVLMFLRRDRLPAMPLTVQFQFKSDPRIYWLVVDGDQPELCFHDPGREIDLFVTLDEQMFGNVLLGRMTFAEALGRGGIKLDGPSDLVRGFPTWIGLHAMAGYWRDPATIGPVAALAAG